MAKSRSARPRHLGFYIAVAAGAVAAIVAAFVVPRFAVAIGSNVFFAGYALLALTQIWRLDPPFLRKHAAEEDAPAPFILFATAIAVIASAASLIVVLASEGVRDGAAVALGVLSVVLSWFAVHTMWAMHYAFEYYEVAKSSPSSGGKREIVGGLQFPGGDEPDGTAFLYFSYVIGMTAQTSDTNVTSNAMRRIITVHSIFSFFFNTVIVAAAVNILVSLGR
jgi:uncharacterized membrane protein